MGGTDSGNDIGWRALGADGAILSPRQLARRENMLAWPARFSAARVREDEYEPGPYGFAGQYQQSPEPRKGGIFKRILAALYRPGQTAGG